MTELPEDVIAYLEERTSGSRSEDPEIAEALLAKYKPQPKTLADRFDIKWTRYIVDKAGDRMVEVSSPNGMPVDERGWAYDRSSLGDVHVWPEVEGIDPRELLNDGWQIRCRKDIPKDWDFAWQGDHGIHGDRKGTRLSDVPMHAVMFCRPPESDNQ